MKMAWLFPGQGSQVIGMGKDLYEASPAARRVLDLAGHTLGAALTCIMFTGPGHRLQETIHAQPAIVAASLAALAAFREAWQEAGFGPLPQPSFVAGHSVGEYAALVAAGGVDEATGLRLVRERARLMHEAAQMKPGSMVAVLGLAREAVDAACQEARRRVAGSYVTVANHNAATQVTIAGDQPGLAAAMSLCQEAGARRCLPLSVSGAFHSEAMAPAAAPLAQIVAAAGIGKARLPLISNVTARAIREPEQLGDELAAQLARPVLWADSLEYMAGEGTDVFLEFGAGQVLTNLVQRLDPVLAARAIGDAASVRQTVPWLARRMGMVT